MLKTITQGFDLGGEVGNFDSDFGLLFSQLAQLGQFTQADFSGRCLC